MNKSDMDYIGSTTYIKNSSNKLIYVNKLNLFNKDLNNKLLSLLFKTNSFNKAIRLSSGYYVLFDTLTNNYYLLSNKKVSLNNKFIMRLFNRLLSRLSRYGINKANRLSYTVYSNSISVRNTRGRESTKKTIYSRNLKSYSNFNEYGAFKDYNKIVSDLKDTTINNFYNKVFNSGVNKNQFKKQLIFGYSKNKDFNYKIKAIKKFKAFNNDFNLNNYSKDKKLRALKTFNSFIGSHYKY